MASNPLHLLYFITEDWFFCSHFKERAVAAREAGYRVTVVTHVQASGEEIRAAGLSLIPFELRRRSLNPVRELAVLARLVVLYRRERPDLVHHFALKPILYGAVAMRLAGLRHCINAPLGMGFVFSSSSRLARTLRPILRVALRLSLNPPGSRVIFENGDDCEEAIRDGLVRRPEAVVIRGAGVDLRRFHPADQEPQGPPRVVLVARMLWEKGVGDFVEAARQLRARGLQARFLVVGAPDRENPSAIPVAQLQAWHREGVIEWLEQRTDIPEILRESGIFCLPSSYREGLPKAILEALASGLPVVTTAVPGCREAVDHGDNGLLVSSRDPSALAEALARLIGDADLRRRMGRQSRRRAEREFASTQVCEATLDLYQRMLKGARKAPADS